MTEGVIASASEAIQTHKELDRIVAFAPRQRESSL